MINLEKKPHQPNRAHLQVSWLLKFSLHLDDLRSSLFKVCHTHANSFFPYYSSLEKKKILLFLCPSFSKNQICEEIRAWLLQPTQKKYEKRLTYESMNDAHFFFFFFFWKKEIDLRLLHSRHLSMLNTYIQNGRRMKAHPKPKADWRIHIVLLKRN